MGDVNGAKIRKAAVLANIVEKLPVRGEDEAARRRRLLAELCKVIGTHLSGGVAQEAVGLSPRMRQTLERLVAGDSEKQIAGRLKVSQNTVHVYVKQLYKRFGASSRGELLSRFIPGAR